MTMKKMPATIRGAAASMKAKAMKYARPPKNVPYVPTHQVVDDRYKADKRNQQWCMNLPRLAKMTEKQTVAHLRAIKILPTWQRCPHCKKGLLTDLTVKKGRGCVQRCRAKACNSDFGAARGFSKNIAKRLQGSDSRLSCCMRLDCSGDVHTYFHAVPMQCVANLAK